jgi:RHS repeat-associated protein
VSVDGGSTASYAHDDQNRRYKKTVGSTVTHSVWEGNQVLAEHNGSTGAVITDYVYSARRMIARVSGGTTQYLLSDLWSTRLVLDTSGKVLGRQAHLPFGDEFAESGTQEKHHFTSYESESESGTDYAVNRQYSQSVGRFGSADPYQASSYLVNPQSWNRYSYVENDPIHNVDPLGLFASYPEDFDPCCIAGGCSDYSAPSEPDPKLGKCRINISTRGRKNSTIDTRSDINSVNFDELGAYEHKIADGYCLRQQRPEGSGFTSLTFDASISRLCFTMPRMPRIEIGGGLYHVISRGNNRRKIFRSHDDYLKFHQHSRAPKGQTSLLSLRLLPDAQPPPSFLSRCRTIPSARSCSEF